MLCQLLSNAISQQWVHCFTDKNSLLLTYQSSHGSYQRKWTLIFRFHSSTLFLPPPCLHLSRTVSLLSLPRIHHKQVWQFQKSQYWHFVAGWLLWKTVSAQSSRNLDGEYSIRKVIIASCLVQGEERIHVQVQHHDKDAFHNSFS